VNATMYVCVSSPVCKVLTSDLCDLITSGQAIHKWSTSIPGSNMFGFFFGFVAAYLTHDD